MGMKPIESILDRFTPEKIERLAAQRPTPTPRPDPLREDRLIECGVGALTAMKKFLAPGRGLEDLKARERALAWAITPPSCAVFHP